MATGGLDLTPILLLAGGVTLGYCARKQTRVIQFCSRLSTVVVWALVFVMGVVIGVSATVANGFQAVALQAGMIAALSVAGSIVAVFLLHRYTQRNKQP